VVFTTWHTQIAAEPVTASGDRSHELGCSEHPGFPATARGASVEAALPRVPEGKGRRILHTLIRLSVPIFHYPGSPENTSFRRSKPAFVVGKLYDAIQTACLVPDDFRRERTSDTGFAGSTGTWTVRWRYERPRHGGHSFGSSCVVRTHSVVWTTHVYSFIFFNKSDKIVRASISVWDSVVASLAARKYTQ